MGFGNSILIGTGGCGRYLVDKVSHQLDLTSHLMLLDTEKNELLRSAANPGASDRLLVIPPIYEGLGDGPYLNYRAIEKGFELDALEIENMLKPFDTIFLYTSLGRHSGSALSFKVAELCKKIGKPVISFAVTPFQFESRVNKRMAIIYSEKLRDASLLVTTVCNRNLFGWANSKEKMTNYFDAIAQYACDSTRLAAERLEPLMPVAEEVVDEKEKKPVVVMPSFITYINDNDMLDEDGMLANLLDRIRDDMDKVSADLSLQFDEPKTMCRSINITEGRVSNAGRCCVCNRWVSAQNRDDPIIQLCVGAEFNDEFYCMKHLPYESEMYPVLHGLD